MTDTNTNIVDIVRRSRGRPKGSTKKIASPVETALEVLRVLKELRKYEEETRQIIDERTKFQFELRGQVSKLLG